MEHQIGLQAADCNEGVEPEEGSVECSGRQVDDLLLDGGKGESVPEGQDGQGDAAQASEDKETVVNAVERASDLELLGVGEESAAVEHGLDEVLKNKEAESQSGKREQISSSNEDQVETGVLDACWHVFTLDLLEVELGENVEPVRDLDNKEELEHEGHVDMGITFPEVPDAQDVLAPDDVGGPQQADDVKAEKLS